MSKKIKAIDIKVGTVKYPRNTSTWISMDKFGLIYISWPTGRTYFRTFSPNYKKIIQKVAFDDQNKTISFVWKGPWETNVFHSGKTRNVTKPFKLKFDKDSDYNYVKKYWVKTR